eukprot:174277-Prymnesium_polylepis.4
MHNDQWHMRLAEHTRTEFSRNPMTNATSVRYGAAIPRMVNNAAGWVWPTGTSMADVMHSNSTERGKTLGKLEPTLVNTTPQKLLWSYAMTMRRALRGERRRRPGEKRPASTVLQYPARSETLTLEVARGQNQTAVSSGHVCGFVWTARFT